MDSTYHTEKSPSAPALDKSGTFVSEKEFRKSVDAFISSIAFTILGLCFLITSGFVLWNSRTVVKQAPMERLGSAVSFAILLIAGISSGIKASSDFKKGSNPMFEQPSSNK